MSAMTVWHTRWMHNSSKGRASRAARVITGSTTRVPWWVMHQPKARVPNSSATWSIRLKAALASARAVSLPLPECQCVSLVAFIHMARLMQATKLAIMLCLKLWPCLCWSNSVGHCSCIGERPVAMQIHMNLQEEQQRTRKNFAWHVMNHSAKLLLLSRLPEARYLPTSLVSQSRSMATSDAKDVSLSSMVKSSSTRNIGLCCRWKDCPSCTARHITRPAGHHTSADASRSKAECCQAFTCVMPCGFKVCMMLKTS